MKLSSAQLTMLENVRDGRTHDAHCRGRSAHGSATSTLASLVQAGLLVKVIPLSGPTFVITARGRIELHVRGR